MNSLPSPGNTRKNRPFRRVLGLLVTVPFVTAAYYMAEPVPASEYSEFEALASLAPESRTTANAVESVKTLVSTLDAQQKEKLLLDYKNEKKPNWSNFPASFVPRNGLRLGELSKEQRQKAMAVVAAVLSKEGYQKVIDIMDGDQRLVTEGDGKGKGGKGKGKGGGGGGGGAMFGLDLYFLAIFGQPSETQPWMVQFGGHHLGVNITIVGKNFILTPTHTGSQPAVFKRGNDEVRPLGRETDTAYKLIGSLTEKQLKEAVISDRSTGELLVGPGRDGKTITPRGIKGSEFTPEQKAMLLDVIGAWVNLVNSDGSAAWMATIKENINETHFAWSGPTEKGKAAYFRIQGPTLIIEYAPQGGTNHIHTVIRNPQNDYGSSESVMK